MAVAVSTGGNLNSLTWRWGWVNSRIVMLTVFGDAGAAVPQTCVLPRRTPVVRVASFEAIN